MTKRIHTLWNCRPTGEKKYMLRLDRHTTVFMQLKLLQTKRFPPIYTELYASSACSSGAADSISVKSIRITPLQVLDQAVS